MGGLSQRAHLKIGLVIYGDLETLTGAISTTACWWSPLVPEGMS